MLSLRGQAVLLFAFGLVACHRAGLVQNGPLTTAGAIQHLSVEEASAQPHAHISGTVTVFDDFTRVMFVQDRTGAVWATLPPGIPNLPGGSSVELTGTATVIGQDRAIIYPSIISIGPGRQPELRQISRADLVASPKNYALGLIRVRIKAMIAAAGRELRFSGETNGGAVEVSLLHAPPAEVGDLPGQVVDLVGVPAPPTQVSTQGMPLFLADELRPLTEAKRSTNPLKLLTTVREVKSLDQIEARRAHPVALRGVVTSSAPASYMLTMQDETGAIYLNADTRFQFPPQGFRILVEGTSSPGDTAASVVVSKITVQRRAPMPAPADMASFRPNDSRLDNLWVHLDGVVRWVFPNPAGGFLLVVATPQFRTTVFVRSGTAAEAARFVPGTAVSFEGTYSPQSDRFRHWRDFAVFTPSLSGICMPQPAAGAHAASQAADIPLQKLFNYGTVSSPMVPIRIRGVVTLGSPDASFYISDGEGGVQVIPVPGSKAVKPGMLVQVSGFLPPDPAQHRIEDAEWTFIKMSPAPEAPVIQPESALDGSYESHWVRMQGRLTHSQQAIESNILVLQSPSALVNVYSTGAPDAAWRSLRIGSLLMVRGVVRPSIAPTGAAGARTVRMLINTSQDIRVVQMASWWTPAHLTATLIASSALLFALFLLASILVQRVVAQSRIIEQKLELEAGLRLEAQAASRAKSQFLASMSHEIRTPMNGILGLTELAVQTAGQPEQITYLQNALQSARSLMDILNDVLDLAKIESGKLTLAEEHFSFAAVLQPIVAAAVLQCNAKGLQFVCNVNADIPDMVIGDEKRLRQIISNLVANACKFTHHGEVKVDTSAECITGERFNLVVHIRDTGIGIAQDQMKQVFDEFEQADRSDSRRYGGTGLGLSICRKLAHLMGGEIEASSRLGEGSDFRMQIPLRREAASESEARSNATLHAAGLNVLELASTRPLRILAAEDNRINRLLLGRILEKAGHQAVFAENGAEALQLWEIGGFDLVLMDLQMPVMDGLEATREIRRREAGKQAHTPIIAVTARAMHADRELTVAAGMDGYVSKPYSAQDILTAIQRVVSGRDAGAPN